MLVVEDQYLLATSVCTALEDLGCEVIGPAGDLSEAQRLLRTSKPDAAVLNFRLRGSTTADLARELIRRGSPVLFLSGVAGRDETPTDLRACVWLDKPFAGDPLTRALIGVFEQARQQAPDR